VRLKFTCGSPALGEPCWPASIMLFYFPAFPAVGEDDYVIYCPDVLEGIRELLPEIAPERVETVEDYFDFNELCKEIRDAYGFRDLGELHEFFWHGHKNRSEKVLP